MEYCQIKIVLLGDSGVGKTSIVQRFAKDHFQSDNPSTKNAGFICKNYEIPSQSIKIRFQIWDTAGQEKYHSMASMYYKDAKAAIITFDITREQTLEGAKIWIKELNEALKSNVLIVLVGNKSDLIENQKITYEVANN